MSVVVVLGVITLLLLKKLLVTEFLQTPGTSENVLRTKYPVSLTTVLQGDLVISQIIDQGVGL